MISIDLYVSIRGVLHIEQNRVYIIHSEYYLTVHNKECMVIFFPSSGFLSHIIQTVPLNIKIGSICDYSVINQHHRE